MEEVLAEAEVLEMEAVLAEAEAWEMAALSLGMHLKASPNEWAEVLEVLAGGLAGALDWVPGKALSQVWADLRMTPRKIKMTKQTPHPQKKTTARTK